MTGFRNLMTGAAGVSTGGYQVDNSAVFNDDDSQYLIRENASNSTTGGSDARKKFTVSLWWKHGNINSGGQNLFIQRNSSSNYLKCGIAGSGGNEGALQFFAGTLGAFNTGDSTAVLKDHHAWYHILFYYDSTDGTAGDRARIYLNGVRLTDFQTSATNPSSGAITQFGSNNAMVINQQQGGSQYGDGYMAEMVVIDGQALTPSSFTETDSNGVLRPLDISAQNFTFGDQGFYLPFTNSAGLGQDYSGSSSTTQMQANLETGNNETNNGDMSGAAAGIAFTARATAKVSSIQIRTSSTGMSNCTVQVKQDGGTGQSPSGSVLTNGEVTGVSQSGQGYATFTFPNGGPEVTAGTTYWFMIPSDTGTWGIARDNDNSESVAPYVGGRIDSGGYNSGSFGHKIFQTGNHFLPINSPTQTTDSPTINAATFSPLITRHQTSFAAVTSDWTFTNGNTTLTHTSGSSGDIMAAVSQLLQPGQKYHFEAVTESMHSSAYARFQLALVPQSMWETDASPLTGTNDQFEISLIKSGGSGSNTATFDDSSLTAPTNKPTTNSRLTFEVDMSTIGSTTVRYYFNGSLDTTYSSLGFADEPYYIVSYTGVETDRNGVFNFNFGSSDFTDTPTSGHTGLTAKDAFAGSAPTIEDGSAYFQATAYSGTGSAREVNQSGNSQFQPDLVWVKKRNGANEHRLVDAVRGATKTLFSDGSAVESTEATGVTGFDSDGFSVGTGGGYNNSSGTYVGWQWLAGNSTASNSNGSITSTVSANQTAGFSIVSWTGSGANATIGHGLGAVPEWIVVKNRDSAGNNWAVYHVGQGNTHVSFLDSTNAMTPADRWQDTTPTSTVFSVDGTTDVNKSTDDMIAYCWCEKPGFSKFGSYEGNNSSDGSYIHLGFRPAFFIAKNIDFTGAWLMFDSAREPFNLMDLPLEADDNKAEAASGGRELDFLSNGVKLRGNSSYLNSSHTFIYMAFAEHPFAGTTPATAR